MPARGAYGDYSPGRGDITGARFIADQERKADHDSARKSTLNALRGDEPCVLVSVGPRSYLIPEVVVNELAGEMIR